MTPDFAEQEAEYCDHGYARDTRVHCAPCAFIKGFEAAREMAAKVAETIMDRCAVPNTQTVIATLIRALKPEGE